VTQSPTSAALAEAVGDVGRVIAVDLQAAMLDKARERAARSGLLERIRLQQCSADSLGLGGVAAIDFALAFWMVHEVPDAAHFLAEVCAALRPGGRFLLVEPRGHVGGDAWESTIKAADAAGMVLLERRRVALSRAAFLGRPAS